MVRQREATTSNGKQRKATIAQKAHTFFNVCGFEGFLREGGKWVNVNEGQPEMVNSAAGTGKGSGSYLPSKPPISPAGKTFSPESFYHDRRSSSRRIRVHLQH
ncbi:hypothetical protein L6452_17288 [Arctium lappa]|uniref:Uncharacterized protein n=1 Tax=Arctium lappa TaxID=4217 RepID=A0ACB9C364_ARCLA|nr:hypothetical protein L6452_17288 [Arctium lappa]